MAKVLLFIVEVFYKHLLESDFNETLKFFSELKNDPTKLSFLQGDKFKDFVFHLTFDHSEFEDFENKHQAINAALNFEPSQSPN